MKNDLSPTMRNEFGAAEPDFKNVENAVVRGYLRTLDECESEAVKRYVEICDRAEMRKSDLKRREDFIRSGVSKPLRLVRILKIQNRTVEKAMKALEKIERAKWRLEIRAADAEKTLQDFRLLPLVRSGSDYYAFTLKVSESLAKKYADEMGFVHPEALENLIWISNLARGEISMETGTGTPV